MTLTQRTMGAQQFRRTSALGGIGNRNTAAVGTASTSLSSWRCGTCAESCPGPGAWRWWSCGSGRRDRRRPAASSACTARHWVLRRIRRCQHQRRGSRRSWTPKYQRSIVAGPATEPSCLPTSDQPTVRCPETLTEIGPGPFVLSLCGDHCKDNFTFHFSILMQCWLESDWALWEG